MLRHAPDAPDLPAVILESGLITGGDRIVVGVSGGPDSLALLHALAGLAEDLDLTLFAAHLDHGLREGSDADAAWVLDQARIMGVEPVLRHEDVRALARDHRQSLEEAGRDARYALFLEESIRHRCRVVAVGHTADDQVETVLLNLVRGAGPLGLAGMAATRRLAEAIAEPLLVRPFLTVWRTEIETYCLQHNLQPIRDPSNQSPRYTRNRVRHELLPLLEARFNPRVRERILNSSRLAMENRLAWDQLIDTLLREARLLGDGRAVLLSIDAFRGEPDALVAEAIRREFSRSAGAPLALDERAVSRVMNLIAPQWPARGRRTDLVGGWRADIAGAVLRMAPSTAEGVMDIPPLPLPVPGRVDLQPAGLWVSAQAVLAPKALVAQEGVEHVDPASIRGSLLVRAPWRGASFRPLGMRTSRKLSDFFIDLKVRREARASVVLVTDEEKIVWVVGHRIDDRVRLKPGAKTALRLSSAPYTHLGKNRVV